jgi:hypothetical protein
MDALKQEIANFLRLLGALLAMWLGSSVLWHSFSGLGSDNSWYWLPRVCGSVLVLAGTVASVILMYQKVVRIKLDTSAKTAEFAPAGENKQP